MVIDGETSNTPRLLLEGILLPRSSRRRSRLWRCRWLRRKLTYRLLCLQEEPWVSQHFCHLENKQQRLLQSASHEPDICTSAFPSQVAPRSAPVSSQMIPLDRRKCRLTVARRIFVWSRRDRCKRGHASWQRSRLGRAWLRHLICR
jgi:hypothetical protein